MPTIINLNGGTELAAVDVADGDLLAIYDVSAGSGNTKPVKKSSLLASIPATTIANLTATLVTSLTFAGGSGMTDMASDDISFAAPTLAAGATSTVTGTLTGAATTDLLVFSFTSGLPAGLVAQGWISGANTVSIRFTNLTAGSITGASYTARCLAITLV